MFSLFEYIHLLAVAVLVGKVVRRLFPAC